MTDLEFLLGLGVPVENIANRAGRTKTAIQYELDHPTDPDTSVTR